MFYLLLAIYSLIDDIAWWKWVLFGSMAGMAGAYIIGASCANRTDNERDPVYAEYSPTRTAEVEKEA